MVNLIGSKLIDDERTRQAAIEGFDESHDDEHDCGQLLKAAKCYLCEPYAGERISNTLPESWPWEPKSWKPTLQNRPRELVKAAALIAAEIDRLFRVWLDGVRAEMRKNNYGAEAIAGMDVSAFAQDFEEGNTPKEAVQADMENAC